MENPKNPWAPSEALLDLEFQQKTLGDIDSHIRNFAKEKNITYTVEKERNVVAIKPERADFPVLQPYVEEIVGTTNTMLAHHKKPFVFVVDYNGGAFVIRAVPH